MPHLPHRAARPAIRHAQLTPLYCLRYLPALWVGVQIACAAAPLAQPTPVAVAAALQGTAFASAGELHVIGVDEGSDSPLRWAAWDERLQQRSTARLALMHAPGQQQTPPVMVERQDAYAPSMVRLHAWRYGAHPVLAWTYQYGAAAQTLELYGLDSQDRPVLLGQMSGALITWDINRHGRMLAHVYEQDNARLTASCYGWQQAQHRLVPLPCR
jgi:hypothetical protein